MSTIVTEKDNKKVNLFDETAVLISERAKGRNEAETLCSCALEGASRYCNAISLLLDNNHVWPAKALLRCLYELTVRLMWTLRYPDEANEELSGEIVDKKAHRWEKSSMIQHIKALKEFKRVFPENSVEIDVWIKVLADEKGRKCVKRMPNYKNLLNEMPDEFKEIVSSQLYSDFNKAVHLDSYSLGKIYLSDKNDSSDADGEIDRLRKLCIFLAENINNAIRLYYRKRE